MHGSEIEPAVETVESPSPISRTGYLIRLVIPWRPYLFPTPRLPWEKTLEPDGRADPYTGRGYSYPASTLSIDVLSQLSWDSINLTNHLENPEVITASAPAQDLTTSRAQTHTRIQLTFYD